MIKSELIEILAKKQPDLSIEDIHRVVKSILEQMTKTLVSGDRIEIRGFASFSLHYRPPRMSRNPQTGDPVALASRYALHFKPGKQLRERINESRQKHPIIKN